jgi:hypothetical protein
LFSVFNGDLITGENTLFVVFLSSCASRSDLTTNGQQRELDALPRPSPRTHYETEDPLCNDLRQRPFSLPFQSSPLTYPPHIQHDNDVNITHSALLARERALFPQLSYTHLTPGSTSTGPGTFYLPIYQTASSATPSLLLWFFDSRAGKAYGTGAAVEDWVADAALAWAQQSVQAMRHTWKHLPPSLAFVHIPTNVSRVLQDTIITPANGDDSSTQDPSAPGLKFPGLNDDVPLAAQDSEGYYHESYEGADRPFVRFLEQELGSTKGGDGGLIALVSGHDHGDAWCARGPAKADIIVCFGKHTGYGGYGTCVFFSISFPPFRGQG